MYAFITFVYELEYFIYVCYATIHDAEAITRNLVFYCRKKVFLLLMCIVIISINTMIISNKNMSRKIFIEFLFFAIFTASQAQDFEVIFDDTPPAAVNPKKNTDQPEEQKSMIRLDDNTTTNNEKRVIEADTLRLSIISKAREYIGVNYRYGRSDEQGFDCSGYVRFVYSKIGITLPHSSSEQYKQSRRIKTRQALPGDLVFFQTRGKPIGHVGIYLGDQSFIHSPSRGKQVCIESLDSDYYKSRLVGFGTFLK